MSTQKENPGWIKNLTISHGQKLLWSTPTLWTITYRHYHSDQSINRVPIHQPNIWTPLYQFKVLSLSTAHRIHGSSKKKNKDKFRILIDFSRPITIEESVVACAMYLFTSYSLRLVSHLGIHCPYKDNICAFPLLIFYLFSNNKQFNLIFLITSCQIHTWGKIKDLPKFLSELRYR